VLGKDKQGLIWQAGAERVPTEKHLL
jgi:hypothetical protein